MILRSGWSELVNQRDMFFGYNATPKAGRATTQPSRATNQPDRSSHQADHDDPQAGRATHQSDRSSHQADRDDPQAGRATHQVDPTSPRAGRAMPGLTADAADWLGRVRGVAGVGTECPSLGKTPLLRAACFPYTSDGIVRQLFFNTEKLKRHTYEP